MVELFGYNLIYGESKKCSGSCSPWRKEIFISTSFDYDNAAMDGTFCHEFSHLLQEALYENNYWGEYARCNLRFSDLFTMEQEATNLGVQVWNWLYPGKPLPKDMIRYYSKWDYMWSKNYYKNHYEYDLKEFENENFGTNKITPERRSFRGFTY